MACEICKGNHGTRGVGGNPVKPRRPIVQIGSSTPGQGNAVTGHPMCCVGDIVRHRKTGGIYEIIAWARMEADLTASPFARRGSVSASPSHALRAK